LCLQLVSLLRVERKSQETRQQVAIKTVKRDSLSAKLFDNLQSEIQILKSLSHRHITKLIDIVVRLLLFFVRRPGNPKFYPVSARNAIYT
jgi:serine/threonine protein kinase